MKISFYVHAWQSVLMFLAGIVCVLASFGGYLLSGGAEELLRRALLNVTRGKASYDSLRLDWRTGRLEVSNIRHEDFSWPKENPIAEVKNIQAEKLFIQLQGWPARVESITVQGMTGVPLTTEVTETDVNGAQRTVRVPMVNADGTPGRSRPTLKLSEGFLQEGKLPEQPNSGSLPRIQFVDCDLDVKFSDTEPLRMNGCKGELAHDSEGRLRGAFSLSQLNDKPFDMSLESLEDGRWVLSGKQIQLETRKSSKNPFASKIDPVGMLVKALFSGEMAARGMVTSLHISVQPARGSDPFSCEGEVGFSNLTFKLPADGDKSSKALPFYLGMLLGVDEKQSENLWPRFLHVDQITTGNQGRVAFHMANGRLDFSCDEGAGSAFTGMREGVPFPALESLKGSVETDAASLPRRILLRGFIGNAVSFETRVELHDDHSRTTEVLLLPRSSDAMHLEFGRSLWRLESRVKDYVSALNRPADLALAEFEVETTLHHFPVTEFFPPDSSAQPIRPIWLQQLDLRPPGLREMSGRFHVKGGFYNLDGKPEKGRKLLLEEVTWSDGGVLFGGPPLQKLGADFHPLWATVYALFATENPWSIHAAAMKGAAELYFDAALEWTRFRLSNWSVQTALFNQGGELSTFAPPELKLVCECKRDPHLETKSAELSVMGGDWSATLSGSWKHDKSNPSSGEFRYTENNIPLALHPLRKALGKDATSSTGVQREFMIHAKSDGVTIEAK